MIDKLMDFWMYVLQLITVFIIMPAIVIMAGGIVWSAFVFFGFDK